MAYGAATLLTGGTATAAMIAFYASMSATLFLGNINGMASQGEDASLKKGQKNISGIVRGVLYRHDNSNVNVFNAIASSKAIPKAVIAGTGFLAARAFPMAALALTAGTLISYFAGLNLGNFDRLQQREQSVRMESDGMQPHNVTGMFQSAHEGSAHSKPQYHNRKNNIFPTPS
jgi:hypothetical protein